jgi:hypothetical protein
MNVHVLNRIRTRNHICKLSPDFPLHAPFQKRKSENHVHYLLGNFL